HWSAKAGTGSAYSTTDDVRKWLDAFFGTSFLSSVNRQMMLDWGDGGYGWDKDDDAPYTKPFYFQSGNGGGFASVVVYIPALRAEVVVFSNAQIPVPTRIAFDIAAMLEAVEYRRLEVRAAPLTADEIARVVG